MGNILSVLIENSDMRICEIAKSGAAITVKNAFQVELPSGTVDDGVIVDVEAVAKVLYAALKNNNIKHGKIAFVITSRKIANKEVTLPYVKNEAKIEEMIKANIEDYFPMNNLEDYIIRHMVLETVENAEGKNNNILVTAVQKQMVEEYYRLASMLKMPVETVDYYNNSLYQLLRKQLTQGVVLAIQMDENATMVSIMRDKVQLFKRSIPYGKQTIIRNLAEFKSIDEEEAEAILSDPRKLGQELTPEEYSEVIRDFSSSVTRMAEFHTSRNPGTVIEQIRLMGTGINLIGFTEILGKELGLEVVTIKELNGVKIAKKNLHGLNYELLADYLPLLGALTQSLNLKAGEEKKGAGSYTIFLILIIVSVLLVTVMSGLLIWQKVVFEKEKARLQTELDSYQTAEATYQEYLLAQQNYEVLNQYYETTENSTELLYQMILDLETVMPESVGIVDLNVKDGSVEITGISAGKDALAKFVIELKKIPYITDVRVDDIADTTTELGGKTSTFNMKWQLVLQDEAADATGTGTEDMTEADAEAVGGEDGTAAATGTGTDDTAETENVAEDTAEEEQAQ